MQISTRAYKFDGYENFHFSVEICTECKFAPTTCKFPGRRIRHAPGGPGGAPGGCPSALTAMDGSDDVSRGGKGVNPPPPSPLLQPVIHTRPHCFSRVGVGPEGAHVPTQSPVCALGRTTPYKGGRDPRSYRLVPSYKCTHPQNDDA